MDEKQKTRPDYIFEVSWEVCNKVGGIHTVLVSKTLTIVRDWEDHYILLGPDIWKGSGEHPEFQEDPELFKTWKKKIETKGLKIRAGRWKITGNPIVVLIDYTSLFPLRDEIFKNLWLNFQVDSLGGGWDYIEPALFGYASGMVIECFYQCHLTLSDQIVAQFHEWLTAAGVLYIEKTVPQIATVFTTHATVLGRTLSGNDLPFYSKFRDFNVNSEAKKWNITSKHSLEKAGAQYADCFTTVSSITARECKQFLEKDPDLITINGFDDAIVPVSYQLTQKRLKARRKLLDVAKSLTGGDNPDDSLLLLKSGRFEFRNKGIDIFIEALAGLRDSRPKLKNVIGFIFVPVYQTGPNQDLKEAISRKSTHGLHSERILTHHLQGRDTNKIMLQLKMHNIENKALDNIKIIYAPVYLDGKDGIFDLTYYDVLPGFDLSIFPSYYEPWGYTPLESLAFHVPTVTTDVSGFGQSIPHNTKGVYVVHRDDENNKDVVKDITQIIEEISEYKDWDVSELRNSSYELSKKYNWRLLIENYRNAYSLALSKTGDRQQLFEHDPHISPVKYQPSSSFPLLNEPVWRKLYIKPVLPLDLKELEELTHNLWWSWNRNAITLFEKIDPVLWKKSGGNPITVLNQISFDRIQQLKTDVTFKQDLDIVMVEFKSYMSRPFMDNVSVAYFCMEFGLENNLKIYSGSLGILAGDYIKEASDLAKNIIGVGLLYRKGYFKQKISLGGEQIVEDDLQKFTHLPLEPVRNAEGEWVIINIGLPGRTLFAKVWRVPVGKTSLYLLDTDIPENHFEDRAITAQLYPEQIEMRLKQELLLGIGGVRLLNLLKINPNVFHCNGSHAAFIGIERLYRAILEDNLSYAEAFQLVRASTLFTTHTPSKAGNDLYEEDLLRVYLAHYTEVLNIPWDELMNLGRADAVDKREPFSMNYLAGKISQEINGVSVPHEDVSRKVFHHLWKGFTLNEIPVGHVTNAVHIKSWASMRWQVFYSNQLAWGNENWLQKEGWSKIKECEDKIIWEIHKKEKEKLIKRIREKLKIDITIHHDSRKGLQDTLEILKDDVLLIGYGGSIATHKRPTLIFSDIERLEKLLNNREKPVLILISGKAHPGDQDGKNLLKEIISFCNDSVIAGKVIFLEDFNIDLAKDMIQGVDLWLNTPERGMEASGTSGMKAMFNGVINFSTLDGWWKEAYEESHGWALPESSFKDAIHINEFDAFEMYRILETEIIPTYFERENGLPVKWIAKIKSALTNLAPRYNTGRMLEEYYQKYYYNLNDRSEILKQNKFEKLKELEGWKKRVGDIWPGIEVKRLEIKDLASQPIYLGSNLSVEVDLFIAGLSQDDISLEILLFEKRENEIPDNIFLSKEFELRNQHDETLTYKCEVKMSFPGVYYHCIRIHPRHYLLPHICDFPIITYL